MAASIDAHDRQAGSLVFLETPPRVSLPLQQSLIAAGLYLRR